MASRGCAGKNWVIVNRLFEEPGDPGFAVSDCKGDFFARLIREHGDPWRRARWGMRRVCEEATGSEDNEMNLQNLTDEEMLSVSAVLLEEQGEIYSVIHDHELLAGPTKVIARIHEELLTVQEQAGSIEKKVKELTDEMTRLDGHHRWGSCSGSAVRP